MKPDRISLIIKWLLLTVLVLVLLPCLVPAKDTANLDKQLVEAAARGDVAQVKALLDKGADVNAKNLKGCTALLLAIEHGANKELLKLLIEKGADINTKTKNRKTALKIAQDMGREDIVALLRSHGAKE